MKYAIPATIAALLCLGAATTAQTPTGKVGVDVTGNQAAQDLIGQILQLTDGTYELTVKEGSVTIVPLTWITPDGPTPPPDDLTQRGKEMRAACIKVTGDPDKMMNTQKMIALYRQVKKQVDAGTLTGQQNMAVVIKGAQELLLGSVLSDWAPVTTQFGAHWAVMVQDGRPDGDYAKYLGEAADGLESCQPVQGNVLDAKTNDAIDAAVQAAIAINNPNRTQDDLASALSELRKVDREAIDPAMIKLIIELIMMIIDMFTEANPAMQPAVMPPDPPTPAANTTGFRFTPHWEIVAA